MGLDISIKVKKPIICPKCGEVVAYKYLGSEESGGRIWYEILEKIGYKNDNWYAKDMELTKEQTREVYDFVSRRYEEIYQARSIRSMISCAMSDGDVVAINADW